MGEFTDDAISVRYDVELTNALNAAQQALDYEVIPFILPTELPTDLLKGRKIAVYRE